MKTGDYHWSLGVLIGIPILIVIVLVAIAIAAMLFWHDEFGIGFGFLAGALAAVVIAAACWWPFAPVRDYHAWNGVQGTVQSSDKRLVKDGDSGMSERYVIKFAESQTLYGCDDTRCSLATPGKVIKLTCKREYQFRAYSGWGCRYGQAS